MKKFIAALFMMLPLTVTSYADSKYGGDDFNYYDNGMIANCIGSGTVKVPDEINGIKIYGIMENAMKNQNNIEGIYISEGIQSVEANAFDGCGTQFICYPSTITAIGAEAMANCKNLTELVFSGTVPCFGENSLKNTGEIEIFIPCHANTNEWNEAVQKAKGDSNFHFTLQHNFVDSMDEKDSFGNSIMYCEYCNFKASSEFYGYELPFNDVNNQSWYFPYVKYAYNNGILNGKSENTFDPDANMTVAEAIKIAACLHKLGLTGSADGFEKSDGIWYNPYLQYCINNHIIEQSYIDNGNFVYTSPCTRGQMAYLFARANTNKNEINPDVPYTDIPDVDENTLFSREILALYRNGIAAGNGNMAYLPDANVKRSEAAALATRVINNEYRIDLPKG